MKKRIIYLALVLSGTLLLMADAFYNRYPMVYSDTSTFLASAFELEAPFDRPMTYGIFLWLASMKGGSLWSVILIQSLILCYLILRILGFIAGQVKYSFIQKFLLILFLSLFTSVSWTVCQVIPDVFTSIVVLCTILIITGRIKGPELYFLYFLFLLSTAMNLSQISFNIVFLCIIIILRNIKSLSLKPLIGIFPIFILIVITIISIFTMGSALSKSRHIFFMGAMVEHGITKKYLEDNCGVKNYKLCAYKDSLNLKAHEFIWEDYSPLYKIGGWNGTKEEFNEIILNTLITPKYLVIHIRESIKATLDQLTKFRIGDGNGPFPEGTKLHERMGIYIPRELNLYETSRQNLRELNVIPLLNRLIYIIVILSLACLIMLIRKRTIFEGFFSMFMLVSLTGIIVNAWISGTFGNAIDRLGGKMMWLVPLLALGGLSKYINQRLSESI